MRASLAALALGGTLVMLVSLLGFLERSLSQMSAAQHNVSSRAAPWVRN